MLHQIKAQRFYTNLDLYQLCFSPTENRIQGLFKALSDFPVLFKADLILKNFQEITLNPSTFQACANPGAAMTLTRLRICEVTG